YATETSAAWLTAGYGLPLRAIKPYPAVARWTDNSRQAALPKAVNLREESGGERRSGDKAYPSTFPEATEVIAGHNHPRITLSRSLTTATLCNAALSISEGKEGIEKTAWRLTWRTTMPIPPLGDVALGY
ncbi:unnamed protein product, partial [Discosporangium mesarthrocarpum]